MPVVGQSVGPAGCHPASVIRPGRCFTCGKVTGSKWGACLRFLQTEDSKGDTLDTLGLKHSYSHCLLLAMGTWPRSCSTVRPWRRDAAGGSPPIVLTTVSLSCPEFIPPR